MRRINVDRWVVGWRWLVGLGVCALALAMIASPSLARHRHRGQETRNILHANRIGSIPFGTTPRALVPRVDRLLRHRPTQRLHVVHSCGVDHAIGWPGLVVFFRTRRFVGYSYRPTNGPGRAPTLATARGLRVGDTLSVGRLLYGSAFHASERHGGSWWAGTPHGRVAGLASGWPAGPRGSVATIAAGDVGCPILSP